MTRNSHSIAPVPCRSDKDFVRDYKDIAPDYAYDGSIFSTEDERVARVKWIIDNKLTQAEKIIILEYTDYQSYRKLGRKLGLSHTCVFNEVRRIKEKIKKEFYK